MLSANHNMATRWQRGAVFPNKIPLRYLGLQLLGGTTNLSAAFLPVALAKPIAGSFFLSDSVFQAIWEKMLFFIQPGKWGYITPPLATGDGTQRQGHATLGVLPMNHAQSSSLGRDSTPEPQPKSPFYFFILR